MILSNSVKITRDVLPSRSNPKMANVWTLCYKENNTPVAKIHVLLANATHKPELRPFPATPVMSPLIH